MSVKMRNNNHKYEFDTNWCTESVEPPVPRVRHDFILFGKWQTNIRESAQILSHTTTITINGIFSAIGTTLIRRCSVVAAI